jgi:hypothetical protein
MNESILVKLERARILKGESWMIIPHAGLLQALLNYWLAGEDGKQLRLMFSLTRMQQHLSSAKKASALQALEMLFPAR